VAGGLVGAWLGVALLDGLASAGNAGVANFRLAGSSFIAAVAWVMNCRQIGPG